MFRRITLAALAGVFAIGLASCAETPSEAPKEEAAAPAPEVKEPEGPFYEITKEEILSHPDWTSRNIMFKSAKLGDKTNSVQKNFGEFMATEPLGDLYRTIYDKGAYGVYTHQMTNELQKIELYSSFSDKVTDPKLKKLLASGDLEYMRQLFGPEEGLDVNPMTTGSESIYDSKGFRFVKYDLPGGIKVNSLLFSLMKKK